jgi:16S rRNA (cytosine967-C5)-methyltransferase
VTPAARLSAAIEVLTDVEERRRPATDALKDWGLAHRFAGSGDRSAIASLVYDALRHRASAGWIMDDATPRAALLGALHLARGWDTGRIAALCSGERFAPQPLSDAERSALDTRTLDDAPAAIAGDYPDWLDAALADAFGDMRAAEARALACRALDRALRQGEVSQFEIRHSDPGGDPRYLAVTVSPRRAETW